MQYTISLVTVCMNRLHHLRQTLPQNITDNEEYSNVEFVVLDYNSTDGLADWINSDMRRYIDNGRLQFYQTWEPAFYNPSHSRNMAFLLSRGQLICNVDADNYTGKGFAAYCSNRFHENEQSILITFGGSRGIATPDTFGRVCVTRSDFMTVKGYNEAIDIYCGEDVDLVRRVVELGRQVVLIEEECYLQRITHTNDERIGQMALLKKIRACYIAAGSTDFSYVLLLFHNQQFVLVPLSGPGQNRPEKWLDMVDEGVYEWTDTCLRLSFEEGFTWHLQQGPGPGKLLLPSTPAVTSFYQVTAQHNVIDWVIRYMLRHGRLKSYAIGALNERGIGHGTVYYNLNYDSPMAVGMIT